MAEVRESTITDNGTDSDCLQAESICNGISVQDESQVALTDSLVKGNADWGLASVLKRCGFSKDTFIGQVSFFDRNVIETNNQSGNQDGQGNPGQHPFNNLTDGQVCLP
ncbi:hypothetical protein HYR54_01535 [Candidatus Acetothermia bacterium]|nr:hypothetical protein [Candidatus Acetothermia bacterium]